MATVDLVYELDCPNVEAARANLLRAFSEIGRTPQWCEYRIGAADLPLYARGFGSPTVLVAEHDVAGSEPGTDACCRLYADGDGATGVPPVAQIAGALERAAAGGAGASGPGGRRSSFAAAPAIGIAVLPKVACPACWPAYAGVLGALGLGFLMDAIWLLSLTAIFLVAAAGALAFRARRRRGYGPFVVGLVASPTVLIGKFTFDNDPAMYAGVALLVAASLWNSWPKRRQTATNCAACAEPPQGAEA